MKKKEKKSNHPFLHSSLISLLIAFATATTNVVLGSYVYFLQYLTLFNVLAVTTLIFSFAAILLGLCGLWKSDSKSMPTIIVTIMSAALFFWLILNP
jgi:hypothetical protein